LADFMVFLRRFLEEPGRVGSIVPSSRFLCNHMLKQVNWQKVGVIVELGPGTGAFTKVICRKKRPEAHYLLVERDPQFRSMLRTRFPGVEIREEAMHLNDYLAQLGVQQADVIISGLPFANFPVELRTSILDAVKSALAPGGLFITFQYSLQLQNELQARFPQVEVNFTLLNIPPAFIYTCRN